VTSSSPLDEKIVEALADTMFALSTPSRLQILYTLLERPHDVSELTSALSMEQSAVSHQLRVLRDQSLVRVDRDGSRRVYALADEHVIALLEQSMNHVLENRRRHGLLARARGG
jgi:DNA-binding transcriptional ArsR family regulator